VLLSIGNVCVSRRSSAPPRLRPSASLANLTHSGRLGAKEISAPTTGIKVLQALPVAGARRRNLSEQQLNRRRRHPALPEAHAPTHSRRGTVDSEPVWLLLEVGGRFRPRPFHTVLGIAPLEAEPNHFAIRRRFCAIAASKNSSCAPLGPRSLRRSNLRIRLRCANSTSTFFRSLRDCL
jgi:hypothetical protein